MPTKICIIGGGGHAKVVIDALYQTPDWDVTVLDGNVKKTGAPILDNQVNLLLPKINASYFHIAIGDNSTREELYSVYGHDNCYHTIVASAATVSSYADIGAGSFLAARALLAADAELGIGCIVNHGASVDHDCRIGSFCHIAPNATLLGGVTLGQRVLIGAGAVILPGVRIGDDVVVGAGAVVIEDVHNGATVVGCPAKNIQGI